MKPITQCILLLVAVTVFISCNNDDDRPPIEQLPLATQTGENTFGCLVNGEAFVDIGRGNNFYQLVDGNFFFSMGGLSEPTLLRQVIIGSNSMEALEGMTYELNCNEEGSFYAEVAFTDFLGGSDTCTTSFGTLILQKFDLDQNIASGTFEFDVLDPRDNSLIEVREGRFDVNFNR